MLEAMYRVCGWQLGPDFKVQTAVGKIYFYLTVKEMRFFFFFFEVFLVLGNNFTITANCTYP